jgi:hypothetical protein
MAPFVPDLKREEGSSTASDDHEQSSLISALTVAEDGDPSLNISTEDDTYSLTTAATTFGSFTLISNASSKSNDSHYFIQSKSTHRHTDSLDYSTDNSTSAENRDTSSGSSCSYLGSIVRSLGPQQAFPSSMFPGQKLISPTSSKRKTSAFQHLGGSNDIKTASSSYFYYSTSQYDDISDHLPLSYQNTNTFRQQVHSSTNVYRSQRSGGFCGDSSDDEDELDEDSKGSSWKRCWRCFFSPRVLVTLAVCGILGFNLLRLGGHHRHSKLDPNDHHSVRRRANSAGFVQLETTGGVNGNVLSSSFGVSLLPQSDIDNEILDNPFPLGNEEKVGNLH